MKRTFRALTTTFSVEIDDALPAAARTVAEFVIADYAASDEPPALEFALRMQALACIGHYEDPAEDPSDLAPLLELGLYRQAAERASPGWLLHAAALERDGRAIVLAGPSGAGKTTLTLGLVARGWRLITEEMTLVDRELGVVGLARPVHCPATGPQRAAIPASWRQLAYPLRMPDGTAVHALAHPPRGERVTDRLPLRSIIRIAHGPGERARLDPLPPHGALSQLWPATLRRDDASLAAATAIVATAEVFAAMSSSPEDAVRLVEGLGLR